MGLILGVDWSNVTGGSVLIAGTVVATVVGVVFMLYRSSPIGAEAVESWKNLAEGLRLELQQSQAESARAIEQRESEKHARHQLEIELARCRERPSNEQIAKVMGEMAANFETHRGDLTRLLTELTRRSEKMEEALGSMQQALIVLVDRNRGQRTGDDPPLSS